MKKKVLLPSIIFLILLTGLSLYNLFYLNNFGPEKYRLDLGDFKTLDRSLNEEIFRFKASFGANGNELNIAYDRFLNQQNIVISLLKETQYKNSFIQRFSEYAEKKKKLKQNFEQTILDLKNNLDELNPLVNSFPEQKISFSLDGKDFYKELVINTHRYVLSPDAKSLERYLEDRKILQQIITFAKSENPQIAKLKKLHDKIFFDTQNVEENFKQLRTETLEKDINEISAAFAAGINEDRELKKNILIITLIASSLYAGTILYYLVW